MSDPCIPCPICKPAADDWAAAQLAALADMWKQAGANAAADIDPPWDETRQRRIDAAADQAETDRLFYEAGLEHR